MLQIETNRGSIYYSDVVIKNIIALSTMECDGVIGMSSRNVKEGVTESLKNGIKNGVKINYEDEKVNVEVFVIVKYGIKISSIANEIIKKIKYNVEDYLSITIKSITVNIQGVKIDR